jgi:hypothetical protein
MAGTAYSTGTSGTTPRSADLLFIASAAILGAAFAFFLFPVEQLLDMWSWWQRSAGDMAAGLIGYFAFAVDDWRWPIFHTVRLDPPQGVNVIYTDLVPVLALVGKGIYNLTGQVPLYMGKWILFSYVMQSLIAALIFRQLGLSRIQALIGAAIILLMPSFMFRFAHIGLVAHFLILASILFYIRTTSVASAKEVIWEAIAIGCYILVNPYLLAMSATIFFAGVLDAAYRGRFSWRFAAASIAITASVTATLAIIFGIVGQDSGVPSVGGFGIYSMNLLSPFIPQLSNLQGNGNYILDVTGGQYEGFNYLGAGILVLLAAALLILVKKPHARRYNHMFLVLGVVALTLFALSNRIYVGSQLVARLPFQDLPVLSSLTSIFRSSGRFFWPVSYLVAILSIVVIARQMKRSHLLAILAAALCLQAYDQWPNIRRTQIANSSEVDALDINLWSSAVGSHSEVSIHPDYYCIDPAKHPLVTQLQFLAVRHNLPVNAAYINRKSPDCGTRFPVHTLGELATTADPLVVIFNKRSSRQLLKKDAAKGFDCRELPYAFVCARETNSETIQQMGEAITDPVIPLGMELSVLGDDPGVGFLASGWSIPEPAIRWAEGDTTSIVGDLANPVCNNLTFEAKATPLAYGEYSVGEPILALNGKDYGRPSRISSADGVVGFTFDLGGTCVKHINVELKFAALKSPEELGMSEDTRRLSLAFKWYKFTGD